MLGWINKAIFIDKDDALVDNSQYHEVIPTGRAKNETEISFLHKNKNPNRSI